MSTFLNPVSKKTHVVDFLWSPHVDDLTRIKGEKSRIFFVLKFIAQKYIINKFMIINFFLKCNFYVLQPCWIEIENENEGFFKLKFFSFNWNLLVLKIISTLMNFTAGGNWFLWKGKSVENSLKIIKSVPENIWNSQTPSLSQQYWISNVQLIHLIPSYTVKIMIILPALVIVSRFITRLGKKMHF